MAPSYWPAYANRVAELLSPGGQLVGVFLYGQWASGPPFPLTEAQTEELFRAHFRLERNEAVTDFLHFFRDMKRWQEWRKIT
jgi:hypothetical protein